MLKRYILFLKKYPVVNAVIAVVYAMVCIKTIKTESMFQMFILRTLLCGAMAFFLYQLSGDKTLASSYNSTWYCIKVGLGFWILALPIGILGLLNSASLPAADNIPIQTITVFLAFLFVGLFEEMAFRAVINDALIYQFRDNKYLFVIIAVVSSLVFGVCHVVGADFSNIEAYGPAIGKIVQTGLVGLSLLFLYWKTRNIWACGVIHGVFDFILSISNCFFVKPDQTMNYVATGEAGRMQMIVYGVITLIELFVFWMIYRKIGKEIDYDKIRKEW